ncbi:glycosyltransferase family 2 protein [Geobacter pickeringii]|uniref:Glycosyl transferase n=1 Tax=Geobacter pickeringii TaxID=345632 RepID=A0A0B5B881_9BACT|nr:glycosyltransferase [Geobacter pickeringii]AJE02853.1 glycosyl transferase [Geobacter pickeringii]
MEPFDVDILLPVWNRPVETRNCLVTLMATAPTARIILLDNGSDRETERLLEEFAEVLGERALFLKTTANQGLIKAVNRGLERAEASCVVIVRNTTVVAEGWLEPMLELAAARPEVGLVVPRLEHASGQKRERNGRTAPVEVEVAHGSFAALLVKKELVTRQGGFDEELDGGVWCLKDYSRRALRRGFLTCAAEGVTVTYVDDVPLGSAARREETVRRSAATYEDRWGREEAFCVYWPKDADPEAVRARFSVLLRGARMGHRFTVVVHGALHKALLQAGYHSLHRSIAIETLPRFFAAGELRRVMARAVADEGETTIVAGVDGLAVPGVEGARPFSWLEEAIRWREESCYRAGDVA